MKSLNLYKFVQTLAVIGILLSVYLLWQQLYKPAFSPCSVNSWINCEAITSGPVAKTLGIPTPLYGLVGYVIILLSTLLKKKSLLLGTALFGLCFCMWIGFVELVQLHVVCPVCIMCQLDMIIIFILSVKLIKDSKTKNPQTSH